MAIGETIALLEGVSLAGLAAATVPKRETTFVSAPQAEAVQLPDEDAAFMSYMNDSGVGAGTSVTPYFGRTGGSSHEAGLPLIASSAGLSADLADAVGMLEGQAVLERKLSRKRPQGFVRESVVTGGSENFYGSVVTGGSSHFPGASLVYTNAGLSDLASQFPEDGPSMPRPTSKPVARRNVPSGKGGDALPDAWLRHHFASEPAYQMFITFAGEAKVRKAFQSRRSLQNSPGLYFSNEKALMGMLLARQRLFLKPHAPWTTVHVATTVSSAQIHASRAGTSTQALSGLNNGFAGLEGKVGRKLKKAVKKVGKFTGKMALAVGKAGASYFTGGASNLVVDAAEGAVKKKKAATAANKAKTAGWGHKGVARQSASAPTAAQTRTGRAMSPGFHKPRLGRPSQQQQASSPYQTQSYQTQAQYDDQSYASPTPGGDYAPAPNYGNTYGGAGGSYEDDTYVE